MNDGALDSNIATVTITVNPVNDLPVAVDDVYSVTGTQLMVMAPGVLGNDTDVDGDMLMAMLQTDVTNGTLTLNANGSFTYVPSPGFNGVDTFIYEANDGNGGMDTATVTLNVFASDVDMDGKPDGCETLDITILMMPGNNTNMWLPDSDGDGILDGQEVPGGCPVTLPTLAATSPRRADTDGDGFSDGMELLVLMTDPMDPNDPNPADPDYADADGDGLPALLDPNESNPDTDGDRFRDGYEVEHGHSANDAMDYPELGDVNGDGMTNNLDAIILFNYVLGNIPSVAQYKNADTSMDAIVNNLDVLQIFNWAIGSVEILPVHR